MSRFESYFARQLEEYVAYRKSLGYGMKSMTNLKTFDQYLKNKHSGCKPLPPSFFLEFRASLNMEPTTINHVLAAAYSFFQYLVRKGDYEVNPLQDIPRLPENDVIPFVFYPQEIDQLLAAICKRFRRTPKYYLTDYSRYMAILLLAHCGMRISEPLRLRFEHYRSKERTLYIEKTKFMKDRLIPVPKHVSHKLKDYLKVRKQPLGVDDNPYLLAGIEKRKICKGTLLMVFQRAVKDIGLDYPRQIIGTTNFSPPTPHSLRHSFAVNTLKAVKKRGHSPQHALPVLATYLGHRSYENTIRYLKIMDARQRRRLHDFANKHKAD